MLGAVKGVNSDLFLPRKVRFWGTSSTQNINCGKSAVKMRE